MNADDCQLYVDFDPNSIQEIKFAISLLQNCLHDIYVRMTNHYVKLNVNKSVLFLTGSDKCLKSFKNQNIPFVIGHDNCFFEICDLNASSIRCLGVYFDENLSMQNHMTYLKKYCYCQLHYLYCIKNTYLLQSK